MTLYYDAASAAARMIQRGEAETIAKIGPKIKHVHVADSNRAFPGYGHTDLDSIFKLLYRAGFEEYASFECFNRPSVQTVLEETAPWVDHIRSLRIPFFIPDTNL